MPGVFDVVTRSHQLHVPPGPWGLFQKRENKSPKGKEGREFQFRDAPHTSARTGVAGPAKHSSISQNSLKKALRLLGNRRILAVPAVATAAPARPGRLVAQSWCSPSPVLPRLAPQRSPGSLMLKVADFPEHWVWVTLLEAAGPGRGLTCTRAGCKILRSCNCCNDTMRRAELCLPSWRSLGGGRKLSCDAVLVERSCPNQELHVIQRDGLCAGIPGVTTTRPGASCIRGLVGTVAVPPQCGARAVLRGERYAGCRADALLEPGHHQKGDSG